MTQLLNVRQLTRRYGSFTAVRDLDLSLERREILGFLGPNGAGKTTCLRMLTGNLAPHAGQVQVLGIDLWREPLRAKAHIGYLSEQPPLYLDQRVDEYLEYSARLHQVPRTQLASALKAVKRRCGLETVGRKLIRKLSKGYRQRVGIAQAILHRPDLIVLDEPTVGLDPVQIREIRDLIRELGQERGVLLSTHILPEVYSVCSRVLILHQGRVVHASAILSGEDGAPVDKLRIQLERPPAPDQLQLLPKVNAVEALGGDRFLLHLKEGGEPADIARHLVEAGWGLRELTPQRPSLEQVLVDLTAQDETV